MANDLLNLLLCHEEQLKSRHSGGVTLGSISSRQKMRLTIEQSLKKNSSLLPSVTGNNFGTFFHESISPNQQIVQGLKKVLNPPLIWWFCKKEKSLELKSYCSDGHPTNGSNLFLKDAIYKKGSLLLLEKTPVTNLGCEGTWHLYKLATNWTLVYGHLNLTPGWSFQSIFGHFWTNGHEYDWISRPRFYLLFKTWKFNTFLYLQRKKIWAQKSQKIPFQVLMDLNLWFIQAKLKL